MVRLFRVFIPASVLALLVAETALLYTCFLFSAYIVLDVDPEFFLLYDGGLFRVTLAVATLLLGLYFQDLYTNLRVRSKTLLLQQFSMAVGVAFLSQAMLTYIGPNLILPRWMMIWATGLVLVMGPALRVLFSRMVKLTLAATPLLFVGSSPVLAQIAEKLAEEPELGYRVLGYLEDEGREGLEGLVRLGEIGEVRRVAAELSPGRIVVGMLERRERLPVYDLLEMRLAGTVVEEAAVLYEQCFGRVSVQNLRPSQLVFSSDMGPRPASVAMQGWYSFAIAFVGFLVALPVMAVTGLLVKLTSKGPILYRQRRVGLNGREFEVLKFRSMYVDAEARTGAVWAKKDDPRITTLGKYLRKFRLDELPQFWNVLAGEMSFVGPRPERPEFVEALSEKIPFYRQRHCVKPGITGWAQVCHKYGDTIEDTITKLEYDLYYIKHLSLALDMYIIFSTLKTVLLGRGAQ
jgi:sugar transferase (PEP-CTERM system associated)